MICSSVKRLGFMPIPQRVMDLTHFWRRFRGSGQGRSPDWLKMKKPACEAVNETEEDWDKGRLGEESHAYMDTPPIESVADLIGELRKLEEQLATKRQVH